VKWPAQHPTALEADVRHLYRRVGAIMRELSAYEVTLGQHGAGELTEPVLRALSAALLPQSSVVGTLGHLETVLGDLWSTLTGWDSGNA
jgi:hypothetical protein